MKGYLVRAVFRCIKGKLPEAAIKVGEDIYFMDYTYYLTAEEEVEKDDRDLKAVYCKVNAFWLCNYICDLKIITMTAFYVVA